MRRFLTTRKEQPERVLVIGTGPSACRIATALEAGPRSCSIVGFVTEEGDPRIASATLRLPRPVLGNLSEMTAIIDSVRPARVIVALGKLRDRIPMQQLMQCVARGVAVEGALQAYERLNGKLELEHMTPGDLLSSNLFCESAHLRPQQEAIARAISLTVAALGLIITAPLIVLVAILIKIDSPGPALFVQKRIGL